MISVFDLFTIGIGPSSSHTVGPMRAANRFLKRLEDHQQLSQVSQIQVELFGSLALTGIGHGTDKAIVTGLEGLTPETVLPRVMAMRMQTIRLEKKLQLASTRQICFDMDSDLIWHKDKTLPFHVNGLRFNAQTQDRQLLNTMTYYSVGGGFIVDEGHENLDPGPAPPLLPFPFASADELLSHCTASQLKIHEVMFANELTWRKAKVIKRQLLAIWQAMRSSIAQGCRHQGILPGGLNVRRRAPDLYTKLTHASMEEHRGHNDAMMWLSLYALAVNEENAGGGRVVTAPTNGAAGIIPAVLNYYVEFNQNATQEGILTFLLTAGAIGILYKAGASISAAEVGCQGEIGVACSMAAGAYVAALGGSLVQIENAAEMGMEHHLGLTCDPIGGLVQIPCIERNAVGAAKAVNIAHLALLEENKNKVTLDNVIATMRQTGHDMMTKYKETALGGLAVNVPEC